MEHELSQAQQDALDKVKQILTEHFDAWVVTYETEVDDKADLCRSGWSARTYTHAIGLATEALEQIKARSKDNLG